MNTASPLTSTTTLTQELPSTPSSIRLILKPKNIGELVKKLLASGIFSPELQQQISEWESEVSPLKDPQDITVALCYLLFTVIHPLLTSSDDEEILDLLLAFEDEIKELLKKHIPPEIDVDQYIQERADEQILIDQMTSIENLFQHQMELLHSFEVETSQHIETAYLQLKERMAAIRTSQKTVNAQLNDRLDALIEKMEQMHKKALAVGKAAKNVGNDFEKLQKSLRKTIECEQEVTNAI